MAVEYTLDPEDIASARLLAIGIRPRLEFALFAATVAGELALSVSPWNFGFLPLLIGLTACLGAFRLMQISKVKEAAATAFRRNETLRRVTVAAWDADGISIQPSASICERILWSELRPLKENDRVILFQQKTGLIHAVPKRAFPDKAALSAVRNLARASISVLGSKG
jgi:hypothetical protein